MCTSSLEIGSHSHWLNWPHSPLCPSDNHWSPCHHYHRPYPYPWQIGFSISQLPLHLNLWNPRHHTLEVNHDPASLLSQSSFPKFNPKVHSRPSRTFWSTPNLFTTSLLLVPPSLLYRLRIICSCLQVFIPQVLLFPTGLSLQSMLLLPMHLLRSSGLWTILGSVSYHHNIPPLAHSSAPPSNHCTKYQVHLGHHASFSGDPQWNLPDHTCSFQGLRTLMGTFLSRSKDTSDTTPSTIMSHRRTEWTDNLNRTSPAHNSCSHCDIFFTTELSRYKWTIVLLAPNSSLQQIYLCQRIHVNWAEMN